MITLIIILIAVPVILLIALFRKNGFKLERKILINRPLADVFSYVNLLKNQDNFNKWVMMDPNRKKTFIGTDGTVGFIYSWESKQKRAGKANMQITRTTTNERINFEIHFERPVPSIAYMSMQLQAITGTQTNLIWSFYGNPRPYYLLRVAHLLFRVKKVVGWDMQESLEMLKQILEK